LTTPTSAVNRWAPVHLTLPGLRHRYPALVTRRHRRRGPLVARLAWPTLVLLGADLIDRWARRPDSTVLLPVITLDDGTAHVVRRFGDRNTPVDAVPADLDGLYTLAGPLWPWRLAQPSGLLGT